MRRKLKKGDACPLCGNPLIDADEVTLDLLTLLAEKMGLPLPVAPEEVGTDG